MPVRRAPLRALSRRLHNICLLHVLHRARNGGRGVIGHWVQELSHMLTPTSGECFDGSSAAWQTEAVPASSTDRVPRLTSTWTYSFTHAPGHATVNAVAERVFSYGGIGYYRVPIATSGRCCQLRDHRSLCRIQGDDTVRTDTAHPSPCTMH